MKIILSVHNQNLIHNREAYIRKSISDRADGVRINLAKMSELNDLIPAIRCLSDFNHQNIFLDLPIPYQKYRCYIFGANDEYIKAGKEFKVYFSFSPDVKEQDVYFLLKPEFEFVVAMTIVYGDGEAVLSITEVHDSYMLCKSENDFNFVSGKSLYFGEVEKTIDKKEYCGDLFKAVRIINPSSVCLSFVHFAEEVERIREILGNKIRIIAKIEDKLGIENVAKISKVSDSIMIGRGDLGVCSDPSSLWITQRNIFHNVKNVIVATDILTSCKDRIIPSRADIVDLSELVFEDVQGIVLPTGIMDIENTIDFIKEVERKILKYRNAK